MKRKKTNDPVRALSVRFSQARGYRPLISYQILRDIMFWVKHWENSEIHYSHRFSKVASWIEQKYKVRLRGQDVSRWHKKIIGGIES